MRIEHSAAEVIPLLDGAAPVAAHLGGDGGDDRFVEVDALFDPVRQRCAAEEEIWAFREIEVRVIDLSDNLLDRRMNVGFSRGSSSSYWVNSWVNSWYG